MFFAHLCDGERTPPRTALAFLTANFLTVRQDLAPGAIKTIRKSNQQAALTSHTSCFPSNPNDK
jgi:hypothetical protein